VSAVNALGAANLRDLGGLPGRDGRHLRHGLLFRSEFPIYLDEEGDGASLLGIRTAVDLRRPEEVAHESQPWDAWGVTHHQVALTAGGLSSWRAGYHGYLEDGPAAVVEAVSVIVRPGSVPALFFCAAGKDRTGVVATLLLSVLGVDRATILRDHGRTAAGIDRIVARLAPTAPYVDQLAGLTAHDVAPHPELVTRLLDWVDARGGAVAWLVANGVPAPDLDTFQNTVLEPATS
jgi:protein-tyrosine phosphatase